MNNKNIYVMSDIHGYYEYFLKMLKLIDFNKNDILYILGDVADRGPDGIKMYQYIMEHDNIHLIRGNHDEMFLQSILEEKQGIKYYTKPLWLSNGGNTTYESFVKLDEDEQDKIIDFISKTSLYEEIEVGNENYILVHAGINPKDFEKPLNEHDKDDLLWIRKEFIYNKIPIDKTIVVGHTRASTFTDYDKIFQHENKVFIDCGIYCIDLFNHGYLGCLRLNDKQEFYI